MRLKTGLLGLDELIEGGLPPKHVYMICGPPGSGKTTFGIQFLIQGAEINEWGLYVAFKENPTNIIKAMSRYNFNLVNHVKNKRIYFMAAGQELFSEQQKAKSKPQDDIFDLGATQESPKNIIEKLKPIIDKKDVERLVIDSATVLSFIPKTRDRENYNKQMANVIYKLKELNATIFLYSEQESPSNFKFEHYLVDGIIFLHNLLESPKPNRAIQIIKIPGTNHQTKQYPIKLTDKGFKVENEPIPICDDVNNDGVIIEDRNPIKNGDTNNLKFDNDENENNEYNDNENNND